jgi:hypothetical protein
MILGDQRGELMLEAIGGLSFLFLFALATAQLADGLAHQLLVRRAASAAVRAAVVVLPDDGRHYRDPRQRTVNEAVDARTRVIEDAARAVLRGSTSVRDTRVQLAGDSGPGGAITTTVEADYACVLPMLRLLCGRDQTLTLRASATLPSQYAPYHHPQGG